MTKQFEINISNCSIVISGIDDIAVKVFPLALRNLADVIDSAMSEHAYSFKIDDEFLFPKCSFEYDDYDETNYTISLNDTLSFIGGTTYIRLNENCVDLLDKNQNKTFKEVIDLRLNAF